MVNQLPYNAAPNDVRKFFGQAMEDSAIVDVAMVRVTADNYGRAASVSKEDAQLKRRFCGQAFVTFATAEDLQKALSLHRSSFTPVSAAGGAPRGETGAAAIKQGKDDYANSRSKTSRNPVNVVIALTQRDLKKAKAKSSATSSSTGALPQRTLRSEEDVAQDVLFVIGSFPRAGADGLKPGLVLTDERLKHLLMTMPEDAARDALAEFHNLSSGKIGTSAAGYLHGICNKWKRGDGGKEWEGMGGDDYGGWSNDGQGPPRRDVRHVRTAPARGAGRGGGGDHRGSGATKRKPGAKNRRLNKGRRPVNYAS